MHQNNLLLSKNLKRPWNAFLSNRRMASLHGFVALQISCYKYFSNSSNISEVRCYHTAWQLFSPFVSTSTQCYTGVQGCKAPPKFYANSLWNILFYFLFNMLGTTCNSGTLFAWDRRLHCLALLLSWRYVTLSNQSDLAVVTVGTYSMQQR